MIEYISNVNARAQSQALIPHVRVVGSNPVKGGFESHYEYIQNLYATYARVRDTWVSCAHTSV